MARVEDLWVRKDKSRTPVYGKGMRYRAEWTPPGEKKHRKSFSTKAAAMDYLAEQVAAMNKGTYVARRRKVLLSDYAETWQKHQRHQRPSSQSQIAAKFKNYIIPTFGHRALDAIQRADIQEAVGDWAESLAPSTLKVTYGYLASMYKAAVLDHVVATSPCVGINLPAVVDVAVVPLRTEKVQELADKIWKPYKPMVVFCAATGLRSSEMRGLTWDRVDFKASMISVDRQFTGHSSTDPEWGPLKTASSRRRIHVGEKTLQLLEVLRKGPVGPGGLIFHSSGRAITRHTANEAWRNVRSKVAGLGDGWHELRHYHASQLIAGGMSPVAVAHRLGHKDATETLRTYAHLWPDDDTRAAAITDGGVRVDLTTIAHGLPMSTPEGQ